MPPRHFLLAAIGTFVLVAAPTAAGSSTVSHALLFQNQARTMDCGVQVPLLGHQPTLVLCSATGIPRPKGPVGDPFVQIGRTGKPKILLISQDDFESSRLTTLKPGSTWSRLGVTCTVLGKAVKCRNGSNHGFTIGNGKYRSF